MYLFCFGTRPEIIKQFPVMNEFKKRGLKFKTLFSGQHESSRRGGLSSKLFFLDNMKT